MNVTIELPDVSGFEYTGEWRAPKIGELYMHNDDVHCCELVMELDVPILKKKAPVYRLVGDPTNLAGPKFVELKALKDAMGLVNLIILDLNSDDTAKYHSLMDLIK